MELFTISFEILISLAIPVNGFVNTGGDRSTIWSNFGTLRLRTKWITGGTMTTIRLHSVAATKALLLSIMTNKQLMQLSKPDYLRDSTVI